MSDSNVSAHPGGPVFLIPLLYLFACGGHPMHADEQAVIADLADCAELMGMPECTLTARRDSVVVDKAVNRWQGGVINGVPQGEDLGRYDSHIEHPLGHGPILHAIDIVGGCESGCVVTGVQYDRGTTTSSTSMGTARSPCA